MRRLRKLIILYIIVFSQCFFNFIKLSSAADWKELKSEHFIVYFTQDEKFAHDLLYKSEEYYKNIASDIGYPRYSDFWTWDNRVKIYIYPDHESFLKATGQPEWSQGMADYKNKKIISFAWSSNFLNSLLPHEMAHLIFRDFIGFKGEVPLWLDEGVAQWEEEEKRAKVQAVARQLLENNMVLTLKDLTKLDIRMMKEDEVVYIRSIPQPEGKDDVLFLSGDKLVHTYYIQAASLVGFLIEKYGSDNFANFCRQLRDGKALEEALRFAYPTHISSLQDLEKEWNKYLLEYKGG
jgi:hypothetical protein